jgi:hypothetical protein
MGTLVGVGEIVDEGVITIVGWKNSVGFTVTGVVGLSHPIINTITHMDISHPDFLIFTSHLVSPIA